MADQYSVHCVRRNSEVGTRDLDVGLSQLLDVSLSNAPGSQAIRGPNGWQALVPLVTDADQATVSFDLNCAHVHQVTLGGNRTLALLNVSVGLWFRLFLNQDATGSRTVTWFSTVRWAGGSPPTLTTTASKTDMFDFVCIATGSYLNVNLSQNM
jgi:hypothetical protein